MEIVEEAICAVELSSGASIDLCRCCKVVETIEETGTFDVLCSAVELGVEAHHDVVGLGSTEELEAVDCEVVELGIVECCNTVALLGLCIKDLAAVEAK